MPHPRSIGALLACCLLLGTAGKVSAQRCEETGAQALRDDARRATQWNWGWGGVYAVSALGSAGLVLVTDDEDRVLALWVGALKSTIGVAYQLVKPIRIDDPSADCAGLDKQLKAAARIERRRHGWFPRASSVALNMAAFAYVVYKTDNYLLASTGALSGLIAGELAIYTSPNEIRSEGLGRHALHVVPRLDGDSVGLILGGAF